MMFLQLLFHFVEKGGNRKGPIKASKQGGGPHPCFQSPKITVLTKQYAPVLCHTESTRHASTVVQKFLAALPSQILQNLLVVMLVNHFAWKNELLVNSACTVKNILQRTQMFWLISLPAGVERMGFPTARIAVWFLGHNINPGFVFCMANTVFPSLKQN